MCPGELHGLIDRMASGPALEGKPQLTRESVVRAIGTVALRWRSSLPRRPTCASP